MFPNAHLVFRYIGINFSCQEKCTSIYLCVQCNGLTAGQEDQRLQRLTFRTLSVPCFFQSPRPKRGKGFFPEQAGQPGALPPADAVLLVSGDAQVARPFTRGDEKPLG